MSTVSGQQFKIERGKNCIKGGFQQEQKLKMVLKLGFIWKNKINEGVKLESAAVM